MKITDKEAELIHELLLNKAIENYKDNMSGFDIIDEIGGHYENLLDEDEFKLFDRLEV